MSDDINLTGPVSTASITSTDHAAGAGKQAVVEKDDIAKSEAVAEAMFSMPSTPILATPPASGAAIVASISASYSDSYQQTTTALLTAWVNNIREENDRIARDITSSNYQAKVGATSPEHYAKLQQSSPAEIEKMAASSPEYQAQLQQAIISVNSLANSVDDYIKKVGQKDSGAISILPLMGAIAISAVSTIANLISPVQSTSMDSISQKVINAVGGEAASELGLLGSLFTVGLIQQTTALGVTKGDEATNPKDFSKNFGANLVTLISSGQIDHFVSTMLIPKMKGAGAITEQRKAELASIVKIILLSGSLAFMYKADTKWITGGEFKSLLDGSMEITGSQAMIWLKTTHINLINAYMNTLSPSEKVRLTNALENFMDQNPSTESLLKPAQLFAGLLETTPTAVVKG